MTPALYSDQLRDWPSVSLVPIAVVLGAMLLLVIGGAQWTVLRGRVAHAGHWVWITALGWAVGLSAFGAVTSPLWAHGQAGALVVAIGVLGGLVMATVMAAVTGLCLVKVLHLHMW